VGAFTLRYSETSTSRLRGTAFTKRLFFAVRADGSTSSGSTEDKNFERRITDFSKKVETRLADGVRLKSTRDYSFAFAGKDLPSRRSMSPTCTPSVRDSVYTLLGVEQILGHRTYHYQHKWSSQDGTQYDEHHWYAPELGCYEIQSKTYRRDSAGNLTGVFDRTSLSIDMGEPDPELFRIPEEYREVKPSELSRASLQAFATAREGSVAAADVLQKEPESVKKHLAALDAEYDSLRQRRVPSAPPQR
jgi:hypothetical protein